jgi:hypothetical protein
VSATSSFFNKNFKFAHTWQGLFKNTDSPHNLYNLISSEEINTNNRSYNNLFRCYFALYLISMNRHLNEQYSNITRHF